MRYIKLFENVNKELSYEERNEIDEKISEFLVELTDTGFEVEISHSYGHTYGNLLYVAITSEEYFEFNTNEIEDSVLSFLDYYKEYGYNFKKYNVYVENDKDNTLIQRLEKEYPSDTNVYNFEIVMEIK